MFLNNILQKSDRLPSSGKITLSPSRPFPLNPTPRPNFYCIHQRLIALPLINNFYVASQKTLFIAVVIAPVLFSFYPHTFCIHRSCWFWFNQCSIFTDFFFLALNEKGSNGQNHSSSNCHQHIKQSPLPNKSCHSSPPLTVTLFEKPWMLFKLGTNLRWN